MKKRLCVPDALKNIRLKPHRKFCVLGDLSKLVGWKYKELTERLEAKRDIKAKAYFARSCAQKKLREEAFEKIKDQLDRDILEPAGHFKA